METFLSVRSCFLFRARHGAVGVQETTQMGTPTEPRAAIAGNEKSRRTTPKARTVSAFVAFVVACALLASAPKRRLRDGVASSTAATSTAGDRHYDRDRDPAFAKENNTDETDPRHDTGGGAEKGSEPPLQEDMGSCGSEYVSTRKKTRSQLDARQREDMARYLGRVAGATAEAHATGEGGDPTDRLFGRVTTFVGFVGFPRSGHSWIAAVLDAAPNAMIANELNAINAYMNYHAKRRKKDSHRPGRRDEDRQNATDPYTRGKLFRDIAENSYECGVLGRYQVYDYTIPDVWQGEVGNGSALNVIGDKKGGRTLLHFHRGYVKRGGSADALQRELLEQFFDDMRVSKRKMIVVLRHPMNMVATSLARTNRTLLSLDPATTPPARYEEYKALVRESTRKKLATVKTALDMTTAFLSPRDWHVLTMEEFATDTRAALAGLCAFVEDLDCPPALFAAAERHTRHEVHESWRRLPPFGPEPLRLVNRFVRRHLADYYEPIAVS